MLEELRVLQPEEVEKLEEEAMRAQMSLAVRTLLRNVVLSRLLWHSLLGLTTRCLSSVSSNSRIFIEFPHCFFCLLG